MIGAIIAVVDPALSAAILDHALSDGDSSQVCERLKERNIPFVLYSDMANWTEPAGDAVHVSTQAELPQC